MNTDNNSKSFSKASLLNFDSFYDDTKYEWYVASTEGLLRLSLALSTTFRLNAVLTAEEHISRNQATTAMEQEDIVALTAEECSPRLLELCLMHTRFPYPNGSNT